MTDNNNEVQEAEVVSTSTRNFPDPKNFLPIMATEEEEKQREMVTLARIKRAYAINSNRSSGMMPKVNKLGLNEYVCDLYFAQRIPYRQIAGRCNDLLKKSNITDITIDHMNVYHYIKHLKSIIHEDSPDDYSSIFQKSAFLLSQMNSHVEILDEMLSNLIDNDAIDDPRQIDKVTKVFIMYEKLIVDVADILYKKLPPTPLNMETLKLNIFNIMEVIKEAEFIDNDNRLKLIQLIKHKVIDNLQFVTSAEENPMNAVLAKRRGEETLSE